MLYLKGVKKLTDEEILIFRQETELKIEELEKELNEKNDIIEKLKEHNQKLFYSLSALQEQDEQTKQEQANQQEEKFDLNDFINRKRGRK